MRPLTISVLELVIIEAHAEFDHDFFAYQQGGRYPDPALRELYNAAIELDLPAARRSCTSGDSSLSGTERTDHRSGRTQGDR